MPDAHRADGRLTPTTNNPAPDGQIRHLFLHMNESEKPKQQPVIRYAGSPDSNPQKWLRINELSPVKTEHFCYRVEIYEEGAK